MYYFARLNRPNTKSVITIELPFGMTKECALDWLEDNYPGWVVVILSVDNPDDSDGVMAGVL
jgi:hypothetical protein